MIPVVLADEPEGFDGKVRQPGLSAIDELVGREPRLVRRGRRRSKIAATEAAIPPDKFPPFWRDAIDDMMVAYNQRCAYLSMVIEPTGNPTVDHVVPKSRAWDQVYEWLNYRLCASVVNSKKGNLTHLVDPVSAQVGWFELNFLTCRVIRGAGAPAALQQQIDATLEVLNLRQCCVLRQEYLEAYQRGPGNKGFGLDWLEHRAPFIAAELRRQGKLVRGDV